MANYRIKFLPLLVIALFCLQACNGDYIYEESIKIENATWDRNKKAVFEFVIEDSLANYELYLNFRHGGDYAYKNIYLFTKLKSPQGKMGLDTAQMLLANNKGRWMGKGIGDIFDYQFLFKKGKLFPERGSYQVEIEQAMRELNLKNVTDIGIGVKKVNE